MSSDLGRKKRPRRFVGGERFRWEVKRNRVLNVKLRAL